ncbi:methyltransferase RsmF C-terminal domain-like protein [Porphyromonas macacae]|nr:hypothetical protein [Porphyromonas macacae]
MAQNVAIPPGFEQQMTELLGKEETLRLLNSLEDAPPVSIRINPNKWREENAFIELKELLPVPWCNNGFYLSERPRFSEIPQFHGGAFYVQEASSMALHAVKSLLREREPMVALDLCAAPGGKSTLLRDILPDKSVLISNEIVPARAHILCENMIKWGHPEQIITRSAPAQWRETGLLFDLILVDAPCSGEGMFRKDQNARAEWSIDAVDTCAKRQREILDCAWPLLSPGGLLVYSTCTFNIKENEEQLDYLVQRYGAQPMALPLDVPVSAHGKHICYRFMPHLTKGEGLFMAVLQKTDGMDIKKINISAGNTKKGKQISRPMITDDVKNWVGNSSGYEWEMDKEGIVHAMSNTVSEIKRRLFDKNIEVLSFGIAVAENKGRKWMPTPALAMSSGLNRDIFDIYDINRQDALKYLKREAITVPESIKKGYVLITHKNLPLGFVNHLGNRSNNLYPSHWRIRHLSETGTDD